VQLHLSKLIKLNLRHNFSAKKVLLMKKLIPLLLLVLILPGCNKDDSPNRNPYLPDYNFSLDINLDLPLYSQLNFPSNPVPVFQAGMGINGLIVMNTGSGFVAWEATCPNQPITECSVMQVDGLNAICPCDGATYNLFNGLSNLKYPLKQYRVEVVSASYIRIYN